MTLRGIAARPRQARNQAAADGIGHIHEHNRYASACPLQRRHDCSASTQDYVRTLVCGVLAGLLGHAEIYVSGGAEHQGPDGGGPVALIVDRGTA